MSILAWTQPSGTENTGVDHLGMRVAGEEAYSQLIDFTTTVTWRPRYFSFLCWTARRAFSEAGGWKGSPTHLVDAKAYYHALKRMEFGMVAATLLCDRDALRVAGSTRVSEALDSLNKTEETDLSLSGDHLRATNGGLSIYAGPMRNLGLLSSAKGLDIPLRGSVGDHLADSFASSLARGDVEDPLSASEASLVALTELGRCCSLSLLDEQSGSFPEVMQERNLLRDTIVDWSSFNGGVGRTARRILSIGIILEWRNLCPDEPAALSQFREVTLLGGARIGDRISWLKLHSIYQRVLAEWRMYQAQAYTTFALESLLGAILSIAGEMRDNFGDGIPYGELVNNVINGLLEDQKEYSVQIPSELKGWWELSLEDLMTLLHTLVVDGRNAGLAEPELHDAIEQMVRDGRAAAPGAWVHNASLLFLLSVVRLQALVERDGEEAWLGSNATFRLSPQTLLRHFQAACHSKIRVPEYLRQVLDELVVKQHRANALRKLAAQPTKDTAKFILQGQEFVPLSLHQPGTSNPRFLNAILFLQDLGYLTHSPNPTVTSDGNALLERICRGG